MEDLTLQNKQGVIPFLSKYRLLMMLMMFMAGPIEMTFAAASLGSDAKQLASHGSGTVQESEDVDDIVATIVYRFRVGGYIGALVVACGCFWLLYNGKYSFAAIGMAAAYGLFNLGKIVQTYMPTA